MRLTRLICLGAIALAGGAAYATSPQIPVKVDFADDVAGPFPANFLCFQKGGGPANVCDTGAGYIFGYSSSCSVPPRAASRPASPAPPTTARRPTGRCGRA